MLNNKGFAVSAVLYTTLKAFLLFLAVVLSMFSSSSDLVRNANTDLINGNKFEAKQVRLTSTWYLINNDNSTIKKQTCQATTETNTGTNYYYYYESPIIVKINSRYGTYYWPKDFITKNVSGTELNPYKNEIYEKVSGTITYKGASSESTDGKISVSVSVSDNLKLTFKDVLLNKTIPEITLTDICS